MLCSLGLIPSSQEKKFHFSSPLGTNGYTRQFQYAHTWKNMHKAAMPNYALSSHGFVRLTASAPLLNGPSTLALPPALPVSFLDRYCNVSIVPSGFYRNRLWVLMIMAQRSCVALPSRPPFWSSCQRVVQCFALCFSSRPHIRTSLHLLLSNAVSRFQRHRFS